MHINFPTFHRPQTININLGNHGSSNGCCRGSGRPLGPAFTNRGHDGMFNRMGGFGFNSPMQMMIMLMKMLMQMIQRMLGGGGGMRNFGGGMPPFDGQNQQFTQPNNFWGTDHGRGFHNCPDHFGSSNSTIHGGRGFNNFQFGGGRKVVNSGYGSRNVQIARANRPTTQRVNTGSQTRNVQRGGVNAKQTVRSRRRSVNQQSAFGNSRQVTTTGNGSQTSQVTVGGPKSVQRAISGKNSSTGQAGAAKQVAKSGKNSSIIQMQGKTQKATAGKNSEVIQVSDPSLDATQVATVDANSRVTQSGGVKQVANLKGPNSTASQDGTGGTTSVVNMDDSRGVTAKHNTNGTTGNTWEINYSDKKDNRVLNMGASQGNQVERNLKGGDDRFRVNFKNPKKHDNITVNGEAGDDTFVLDKFSQDPSASVRFNGGEGNNSLQVPASGNFTAVDANGKVVYQRGEGGPSMTVTDIHQIVTTGRDGKSRTLYSARR